MAANQGNRAAGSRLSAPAGGGAAIVSSRQGHGVLHRVRRAAHRRPHADIAIAAILFAVVLLTAVAGPPQGREPLDATWVLAAVACAALTVRRRWPFPVLVVSSLTAEAYLAPQAGHDGVLLLAAPLIALYTVAEASARRRALLIGGLAVLALGGAHMLLKPTAWIGAENIALAALGGLAVAAGDAARNRRAYLAEVEDRVRRAEDDREREARRQVTDERLRIARDLHDVVGHQLALINVQAGVAAHVLDEQPDQVRQSLVHIRQASRTALEELRDTIGLLREFDEPDPPTRPTAGLAGLADLITSFRDSGLRIDDRVEGVVRRLPPATDLTAYRMIQESLTNVRKHAGAVTARLRLDYQPTVLRIVVDNDVNDAALARSADAARPAPASPDGTGHGIVGMRERVAALGGDLRAGPRPGGFQVCATLPLPALPLPTLPQPTLPQPTLPLPGRARPDPEGAS
ncbi:sensor histidine kinase [Rugosimonospora africana]|uniref:sensor histidine kinase n=1 Tax=Rugosimonospora africana TaxID=556532 RepID=UPI001942AF59|nr:histidine kinase [Rugosimonospora africana]